MSKTSLIHLRIHDEHMASCLSPWLRRLRLVSEEHFRRHGGKWSTGEQIAHTHSEVSELYDAIKKKGPDDIAGECWDVFFSAVTNLHIIGMNDVDIAAAGVKTLRKIEERMGIE